MTQREIATLRSRGATVAQVAGIAALEALILGGLGLALGWPLGEAFAYFIGRARSFLDLSAPSDLRVGMTLETLRFGLLAVALAWAAQVIPTLGAARHTMLTYKQELARPLQPPRWQQAWMDVLLLMPAAYGAYLLRTQGGIALPMSSRSASADPFHNPLLFLIPALGSLALTLLVLRLLPLAMASLAGVTSHTRSVGLLMAARHLSRTPRFYNPPLVLLILTLGLFIFTASLAQTVENHLHDQVYYRNGADMHLVEYGELTGVGGSTGSAGPATGGSGQLEVRWQFLPVSEHLKVPEAQAATRVGRYAASYPLRGWDQTGVFIGVDRSAFPEVAFWRKDFAPQSLGALMNALALTPNGVLAPRNFLALTSLEIGDAVHVTVMGHHGLTIPMDLQIVGVFDLFPTWYQEDGPLFVGNLDYLYEQAGGPFPYDVWLKTDRSADFKHVVQQVRERHLQVLTWDASPPEILQEQRRPEQQGLFGLLSVGFFAAALLTVLGFLLYTLFSFRRRVIEIGVLRAVGLSATQMAGILAWELTFIILTGIATGTAIGVWISRLIIPYLQIGGYTRMRVPPFLVEIAWPAIFQIYVLFGFLFIAALVGLVALLLRMKIFEAVKLGETA